jgi:hypothetical protein
LQEKTNTKTFRKKSNKKTETKQSFEIIQQTAVFVTGKSIIPINILLKIKNATNAKKYCIGEKYVIPTRKNKTFIMQSKQLN